MKSKTLPYPVILLTCFKNFPLYGIFRVERAYWMWETHRCITMGYMTKAFRGSEDSVKRPNACSGGWMEVL